MFKNIKAIKGVKSLTKGEQKTISGGFFGFGCQPQILECNSDSDCPFCSQGCGIEITLPDGEILNIDGVCAF